MEKERKDHSFIKKPIYPGGNEAMKQFIKDNLKYPKAALENKIEGYVALKYEINYKGEVNKARVVSGLGYGCDEEATRLVKLFKFQVPKNPRKLRVKFSKSIKIHFKLKASKSTQINYSIKQSDTEKDKPQSNSSYSYSINIE